MAADTAVGGNIAGNGIAGRVAVVTGAAGGLGSAIAQRLHDLGARLALVDLDAAGLAATAKQLDGGDDVAEFPADLGDDAATEAIPDLVLQRFGALDILVNNAGVRQIAPLLQTTAADWRKVIDVDLTAPFVLSRAALPTMLAQGRGKIVNIASMAGLLAFENRVAYCAAKAGLIMLTKSITYEYGARGIWCNAVGPGVIETPLTHDYFQAEAMAASIRASAPMGRWGQPDEIARPVAFLCSAESDYVNGTTLFADGGWTAGKGY